MTMDVGWEGCNSGVRGVIVDLTGSRSTIVGPMRTDGLTFHGQVTTGFERGALPKGLEQGFERAAAKGAVAVTGVLQGFELVSPQGDAIHTTNQAVRYGRTLVAEAYHAFVDQELAGAQQHPLGWSSTRQAELWRQDIERGLI